MRYAFRMAEKVPRPPKAPARWRRVLYQKAGSASAHPVAAIRAALSGGYRCAAPVASSGQVTDRMYTRSVKKLYQRCLLLQPDR